MNAIARFIDLFNDWFGRIVAPIVAVLTIVVVYDISLRFFIGRPSDWAFEVTKQLFAAHFMLLAAYALYHRAHVEVDVIKNLFSKKGQAILDILGYVVFFAPFIYIYLDYSWSYASRSWERGETTYGMVSIPVYPVKMLMVVTGVLLLIQAIAIVLQAVQRLRED
ncbi:TRAP transporter small permease subunit [Aquisalimonas sp.]|uniref:TRAP transporter small permease subunit n=1 Tax=Aquisalimonas sp. TaxID=1872621 RepID=UPI0025C124A2|nr:TRAP transporter small permease subunit [Aquisalimonas sp.]